MIIAITGKIGSGKDTVGSIIQYLTSECGDINSKSYRDYKTFLSKGGGSAPRQFDFHYQSNWEIKKFAGKLKEIASLLTGIPVEKFEDQEFKKTNLSREWETWYPNIDRPEPMTTRNFLQKLGTEAMRNGLHSNTWVNALFADYKFEGCRNGGNTCETPNGNCNSTHCYPNWIITDLRFPNELQAIKERGGITIKVNRDNRTRAIDTNLHPSETALDNFEFDYTIHNNSTIEKLEEEVRKICKQIL